MIKDIEKHIKLYYDKNCFEKVFHLPNINVNFIKNNINTESNNHTQYQKVDNRDTNTEEDVILIQNLENNNSNENVNEHIIPQDPDSMIDIPHISLQSDEVTVEEGLLRNRKNKEEK